MSPSYPPPAIGPTYTVDIAEQAEAQAKVDRYRYVITLTGPTVYVLWAEDHCAYVGMSEHVYARLKSHRSKPWWPSIVRVEVIRVETKQRAIDHEEALIAEYAPRWNISPGGRWWGQAMKERATDALR